MEKIRTITVDLYQADLSELQRVRDILIKTIDNRIINIQKLVDRKEEEVKEIKEKRRIIIRRSKSPPIVELKPEDNNPFRPGKVEGERVLHSLNSFPYESLIPLIKNCNPNNIVIIRNVSSRYHANLLNMKLRGFTYSGSLITCKLLDNDMIAIFEKEGDAETLLKKGHLWEDNLEMSFDVYSGAYIRECFSVPVKAETPVKNLPDIYPFKCYVKNANPDDTFFKKLRGKITLDQVVLLSGLPSTMKLIEVTVIGSEFGPLIDVKKITPNHGIIIFNDSRDASDFLKKKKAFSHYHNDKKFTIASKSGELLSVYLSPSWNQKIHNKANPHRKIIISNSDTVLVENIPPLALYIENIKHLMETFGEVTRVLIRHNDDDEETNTAYVVFKDPKVASKLVNNPYPFRAYKNDKRNIKIKPAEHLMTAEELDKDLEDYILREKDNM